MLFKVLLAGMCSLCLVGTATLASAHEFIVKPDKTQAAKGESVSDTARVIGCYADIIAMRHPKEGAPLVASMRSEVPVINAGDGGHNHPTQTLTDLLTINREKGRFNDLTVGFCGDLKFGRTVHSLISALSRYTDIKFVLVSPEELKLPSYVKNEVIKKNSIPYEHRQRYGGRRHTH